MYLRRFQGILKILYIIFTFNPYQSVFCIHCGQFGFSCINENWYRNCDVYKKSFIDNYVNVCPERTICNEDFKRACSPDGSNKKESDREIENIMATKLAYPKISTKSSKSPGNNYCSSLSPSTQSQISKPSSHNSNDNCDDTKSSKPHKNTVKKEKNWNLRLKSKSKKIQNLENKHRRDVWKFEKNEPSSEDLNQQKYMSKDDNELNSVNPVNGPIENSKIEYVFQNDGTDSVTDYNDLILNSDLESQDFDVAPKRKASNTLKVSNKIRNPVKAHEQFNCPGVGSFPIDSDDSCFYVCYHRGRSAYGDLKAAKVCCPKFMHFNKISHRCDDGIAQYNRNINWRTNRLRNGKIYRNRFYHSNK